MAHDYHYYRNGKKREQYYLDLIEKLEKISTSYDFIIGVMTDLETEEQVKKVSDFIDKGENVNFGSVSEMAILINYNENWQKAFSD